MSVLSTIFSEIYEILVKYNETPIMRKSTFINWYANSDRLYNCRVSLKSLTLICEKPLHFYIARSDECNSSISNESLQELNHEIDEACSRYKKVKAFW